MNLLDPYRLQEVCQKSLQEYESLGKKEVPLEHTSDATEIIQTIDKRLLEILRKNLLLEYPFLYDGELQWIANTAAGATGWMALLYTSLTEYVLIFGSSNTTDGHSGRYHAAVYDCVLVGEMNISEEHDPTVRHVFRAGRMGILPRGKIKSYSIKEGTWMLEYARGNIISMIPTGVGDNLFSNFDLQSLGATVKDYAKKLFYKRKERKEFSKKI
jgi:C-8 sterol isomerase